MAGNRILSPKTDSELLRQFEATRDESAFELLVRRHQRLVMGVCRRVLADESDVEDAFQATFLVLSSSAGKVRKKASLASWLYGVAYRVSLRASKKRYRRRETPLEEPVLNFEHEPFEHVARRHEQRLLSEELSAMPERVRGPLVMHYFGGQTGPQIATELGISVSAVEGRLKRGRKELADRLARRGLSGLAVGAILGALSQNATHASETLISSAVQVATTSDTLSTSHGSASEFAREEVIEMAIIGKKLAGFTMVAIAVAVIGTIGSIPLLQGQSSSGQEEVVELTADAASDDPFGSAAEVQASSQETVKLVDSLVETTVSSDSLGSNVFADVLRANQDIEKKLASKVDLQFDEIVISDLAAVISRYYEIPVVLDYVELQGIGMDADSVLPSMEVEGITLRSFLNLVLEQSDLNYVIRDEVLMITSQDAAEFPTNMPVKIYSTEDFGAGSDIYEIIEMIQKSIASESWEEMGGSGSIAPMGDRLVIRQTEHVHQQIQTLIEVLKAANTNQ